MSQQPHPKGRGLQNQPYIFDPRPNAGNRYDPRPNAGNRRGPRPNAGNRREQSEIQNVRKPKPSDMCPTSHQAVETMESYEQKL